MTIFELVTVIEDADAAEPPGRRRIILQVRSPQLLGQKGRYLGHDDGGPVYGYTRKQARQIRADIFAAAAEDVARVDDAPYDDGFGDEAH